MTYQVLARKWRPQDFTDMVGQDHISSTLCNAIKNSRVGHAYLFVGTRGTGKTTTARIFAKAINCENPLPDANPCNKCGNCVEITNGSSMDVLEIDGASNNGVDDIRRLRDNVQYTPARCKFKVYIIDEVHMLSTAAWNALLKTLEEPPEHVKFLFATTEAHKVLPTILSRCQRFDLKRITQGTIARRLQEIAQQENAKFDTTALTSIARAANGGMRDALSIMDQMIAFCSDHDVITEHDVSEVFGLTSSLDLGQIMSAMLTDNANQLITEVNRLADKGRNLEQLYSDLLHFCRNLMICAISGDTASDILDLDEYDYNMAQSIVSQTSADTIQKLMDGFLNYDGKLRSTLNKRVFMEMTLVRIMKDAHTVSLNDILARINQLRKTGSLDALEIETSATIQPISLPEPQKKNDLENTVKVQKPEAPKEVESPLAETIVPEPAIPEIIPEQQISIPELVQVIEEPAAVEAPVEVAVAAPEPIKEEPIPEPVFEPETKQEEAPVEPAKTEQLSTEIEQKEIDDSFELPYSTFLDEEYIAKARLEDPINIGVKKAQGNFDENRETPGSALGLYYTVGANQTKPKAAAPEPIKVEPIPEQAIEPEPAFEPAQKEEVDISTHETVQEIKEEPKEEYIPEQAIEHPQPEAKDSLEEISQDLTKNIPEETPESLADAFWKKLLTNDQSSQLKSLIQNLNPVSYQSNRFYAAYETGQFELDENSKALLEGELKKITDNPEMELLLVGASKDVEDDKPVLTSGDDVWSRVQGNPFFTNICKEFDGKIIDVRG
ncbi:MAG: DNA polymerase III subunit gamma/tau [Lentisphaeraceae bacterium]|nr:DNA polymerase III subunit gamma/tau [Lentisphaeraceae bacterium]